LTQGEGLKASGLVPRLTGNCRNVPRTIHLECRLHDLLAHGGSAMPEEQTKKRARQDKAEGKAPSTQAGEFVREEIDHIREGKHGARSTKQAIAIGLSKARRAGVELPPPKSGSTSERTRKSAARDSAKARAAPERAPSPRRSRAAEEALKRNRAARQQRPHCHGRPTRLHEVRARRRVRQSHEKRRAREAPRAGKLSPKRPRTSVPLRVADSDAVSSCGSSRPTQRARATASRSLRS
jgi:hypothetical protein